MSFLLILATLAAINSGHFEDIHYTQATAPEIITAFEVASAVPYNGLLKTIKCESGFNPKALNPTDGHGGSRGLAQFQTSTFNKYAPLAGVEDPDIWNPVDQLRTASYMFSIGQAHQWSCFK